MTEQSKFQQRLAEKRAKDAAAAKAKQPSDDFEDVVPDAPFERSAEDKALDDAVSSIDIIRAYNLWCGKMTPEVRSGQTEGIKISCPIPGHRDSNPSAWINTKKQTWYCGTCSQGGDAHDIAAFKFGFPVPGYKEGARFHDLRREMAKSAGFALAKPPGAKAPIVVGPAVSSEEEEEKTEEDDDNVVSLIDNLAKEGDVDLPSLEWREIVTPETFLDAYMKCCIVDDVPEEYHFWNGLLALGMAVGRDVVLFDTKPVLANMFLCLMGPTGDGKSRSFSHLEALLEKALPSNFSDPNDKGVVTIGTPASAEVLIYSFSKPVYDPTDPKIVAYYAPVRGLVEFNELSQLAGRGARMGNVLKPTLMQFYDGTGYIASSSMTSGKKVAKDAFGSCFTTVQPKSLKDLVTASDVGSGFLNRWVFASGKRKERVAIGGARADISSAVSPLQSIHGWGALGKMVQWTPEGLERFSLFLQANVYPQQQKEDADLLMRVDLLLKKLVLLFCINEKLDAVTPEIVQKIEKMYPYILETYGVPASEIGNTEAYQIIGAIKAVIQKNAHKHVDGVSLRDINRSLQRRKFSPVLIQRMLDFMVTMGEVEMKVVQGTRGPATARYRHVG